MGPIYPRVQSQRVPVLMAPLTLLEADDGVVVFQSDLWATNSVLVPAGDSCLVCDPSIFPDEIEAVLAATRGYGKVYLLLTHSDFDHICGVPAFAGAVVIAAPGTADAVAAGAARRTLDESGAEWGASWPGPLHVDEVVDSEVVRCGGCNVLAIDTTGHAVDGSAFLVADRRLLLPGDYLSAVSYPVVLASLEAAVAANERLLGAMDEHAIATVIPGHGPALNAAEARRIGQQDIEYLRALQAAAAQAVHSGASAGAALVRARSVAPPRPARPDLEAFDLLSATVRVALGEAGHPAFG